MTKLHPLWDAEKQAEGMRDALQKANEKIRRCDFVGGHCAIASAYYSRASFLGGHPVRLLWPWNAVKFFWFFFSAKAFAENALHACKNKKNLSIDQADVIATVLKCSLFGFFGKPQVAMAVAGTVFVEDFDAVRPDSIEFALLCVTFVEAVEACSGRRSIEEIELQADAIKWLCCFLQQVPVPENIPDHSIDLQWLSQLSRVQRRFAHILQKFGGTKNSSLALGLLDEAHKNALRAGATSQL